MRFPNVQGLIRRRLLVNYRAAPAVVQRQLPSPFRPKLHAGYAIAGICLIRLEDVRPRRVPRVFGLSSENAAHRIAVEWKDDRGQAREGVYIPRRDTGSLVNHLGGGRVFPGEHHRAHFQVSDAGGRVQLHMRSADGAVEVSVAGREASSLPSTSIFRTLGEASAFFEPGSVGYSATSRGGRLDGIRLEAHSWSVEPLDVDWARSSYFEDERLFPPGSVTFDCALVMRNIGHEWHAANEMYI